MAHAMVKELLLGSNPYDGRRREKVRQAMLLSSLDITARDK